MIDRGKQNLLGVLIDAVDYEGAVKRIMGAAQAGQGLAATALAVHGVMTGVGDKAPPLPPEPLRPGHAGRSAGALGAQPAARQQVARPRLRTQPDLGGLQGSRTAGRTPLLLRQPPGGLRQADGKLRDAVSRGSSSPGRNLLSFGVAAREEKRAIAERIRASGAQITFVGLGCPRQEVFAYEYKDLLQMPVIAVGAAFDYHAGLLDEPPQWMQDNGLHWFYRLVQEPRRLWRRYLVLNSYFVGLFTLQALRLWRPSVSSAVPPPGGNPLCVTLCPLLIELRHEAEKLATGYTTSRAHLLNLFIRTRGR